MFVCVNCDLRVCLHLHFNCSIVWVFYFKPDDPNQKNHGKCNSNTETGRNRFAGCWNRLSRVTNRFGLSFLWLAGGTGRYKFSF